MRGDGLEKITYKMIGPVRYCYKARDMAKEQGIRHFVYPRFTRTVSPHRLGEKMHVNEAYELVRDSEMRNEQIIADVRLCIERAYGDFPFFSCFHNLIQCRQQQYPHLSFSIHPGKYRHRLPVLRPCLLLCLS